MIWRLVVIVAAVIALASLAGCESTQETSQRLSLNAKKLLNEEGLKITKRNAQIKAVSVASIKDQYGTAVVVNLKNSGPTQLNVPIAIALIGLRLIAMLIATTEAAIAPRATAMIVKY